MSSKQYTFIKRNEAIECSREKLATVVALEFHIIKRGQNEESDAREIQMVLRTDEKVVAVKFPVEILKVFEEEVKGFYDRYAKFF